MPVMNYLMIYHIFGLLWTAQFLQGIGAMTISGAVCAWYFSQLPKEAEGDEEAEKLRYPRSRFPICASLYRTLRFYLGSIAFGSLLIAFIQFIRLVFAYIQKKLEPQAKNNASLRFILCCIQCCLKCLQSLVETVTRNAYVFTALKGGSFCASGGMVFKLIVSHGTVFAAVNVLGEIIMFLGKVRGIERWMAETGGRGLRPCNSNSPHPSALPPPSSPPPFLPSHPDRHLRRERLDRLHPSRPPPRVPARRLLRPVLNVAAHPPHALLRLRHRQRLHDDL
jgi:hypothetical protein